MTRQLQGSWMAHFWKLVSILLVSFPISTHAGVFDLLTKSNNKPIVLDEKSDFRSVLAQSARENNPQFNPRNELIERIGISAFQIHFVTDSSLSQTKKNIGSGREARASVEYKLEAPSPEIYQVITDQLLEQFQSELRSRGYEIIPAEELQLDADFAKRLSSTENIKNREAGFFTKNGAIVVNARGTADTFGIMQGATEMHLAERFGKGSAMLKVRLQINFASLEEMGFLERAVAAADAGISHKVGLTLDTTPDSASPSQISMATSSGLWPRPLMLPIYMNQAIAKKLTKLNESNTEAAIGFLMSLSGGSSRGSRYVVTPADDYQQQLEDGLKLVMKVLAESVPVRQAATKP